jgi:hypothetical protein
MHMHGAVPILGAHYKLITSRVVHGDGSGEILATPYPSSSASSRRYRRKPAGKAPLGRRWWRALISERVWWWRALPPPHVLGSLTGASQRLRGLLICLMKEAVPMFISCQDDVLLHADPH